MPGGGGEEAHPKADADKATALGSAFHRAAQFAIEAGSPPDGARIAAIADALALSPAQRRRLAGACERWFGSVACAETHAWELRRAEVPFVVALDGALMEGEIDLLCTHGAEPGGAALAIDYKTGGSASETPAQLHGKHLLQAQCYAYALLSQGFDEVELRFVRVERPEPPHEEGTAAAAGPGEPQAVSYRFARPDLEDLRGAVAQARRAARA